MNAGASLANRLSVAALHDLAAHCPKTLPELECWIDQCGFWLADLVTHPMTADQVQFMVDRLKWDFCNRNGGVVPDLANILKHSMREHQTRKEVEACHTR